MESLRDYVSGVKLPNYQEIRNGNFFKKMFEAEKPEKYDGYLLNFENKLIYVQEVLIWTDIQRSVIWLLASQLFLYQFCISTTPVLSTSAYLALAGYLYTTWRHRIWPAIKVPEPEISQDTEKWTSVHPDTYSAPELEQLCSKSRQKIIEIYEGIWLLRSEEPLRFCIVMSSFFTATAFLGVKVSTPFLIHTVALLAFTLPPLLIYLARNDEARPCLLLIGEIIISISNSLVYTGSKIVPKENHELDEFLPEDSVNTRQNLEITQYSTSPKHQDADYLDSQLAPDDSFPSHEELELEVRSLQTNIIQEIDLIPALSPAALAIENSNVSDEDDDIMIPHGDGRLINVDASDSDEDEFSLRGMSAPAVSQDTPVQTAQPSDILASSLTHGVLEAATAYLPSSVTGAATAYLPSMNQVLGSLVAAPPQSQSTPNRKNYRSGSSEPNLDDFELISEEELEKESQNEFLD